MRFPPTFGVVTGSIPFDRTINIDFAADPLDLPPGELEIWPIEGQVVKVKVKRATHSLRVPRELETEDETIVLIEPVTYEPKEQKDVHG